MDSEEGLFFFFFWFLIARLLVFVSLSLFCYLRSSLTMCFGYDYGCIM